MLAMMASAYRSDKHTESVYIRQSGLFAIGDLRVYPAVYPLYTVYTGSLLHCSVSCMNVCTYLFNVLGTNWGPTDRVQFM